MDHGCGSPFAPVPPLPRWRAGDQGPVLGSKSQISVGVVAREEGIE